MSKSIQIRIKLTSHLDEKTQQRPSLIFKTAYWSKRHLILCDKTRYKGSVLVEYGGLLTTKFDYNSPEEFEEQLKACVDKELIRYIGEGEWQ